MMKCKKGDIVWGTTFENPTFEIWLSVDDVNNSTGEITASRSIVYIKTLGSQTPQSIPTVNFTLGNMLASIFDNNEMCQTHSKMYYKIDNFDIYGVIEDKDAISAFNEMTQDYVSEVIEPQKKIILG